MGNDDLSTLCSVYNPNEIAYFKMIIGLIMESDPSTDFYTASSTSILNAATSASTSSEAATTFSSFKKTDAEVSLGKFVDDHWLYRTRYIFAGLAVGFSFLPFSIFVMFKGVVVSVSEFALSKN